MTQRSSKYDSREAADWAKGGGANETINVAEVLRRDVRLGSREAKDILSTPLFAEGRDPSGFAAVVKKHFVTLEGFKDVNGTAHALRKGGVANYVNHMMSAAPHGMQDMVRPHSGMTFLTHNSVQTQAAYDQGGRFQAGVNRSHTAGGDEQTTASTAGVLLSTSQLAHNLPAPLAKISFEDALLRMAEGGRNSQVYRSNFWLVKEVLEEV